MGLETLGINYAQEQAELDSSRLYLIDENTKEIKAKIPGLKNLVLVGIAATLTTLMFVSYTQQSSHKKLDLLEKQITAISDRLEQDKIDALSSQIEALRAEVKGDQLQVLTQEIKQLEAQLKAVEETNLEQCFLQLWLLKINCTEIKH